MIHQSDYNTPDPQTLSCTTLGRQQLGDRRGTVPSPGFHSQHLLQDTGKDAVPMDQLWEGQTCPWRRGRAELRLSCGVQGTYPERPSVRSSPASHCGTGVSGLHQGAPTPPVRSRQPHPQMSLGPAKMGMVQFMCSLLSQDSKHLPKYPPSSQAPHLRGDPRPWCH